MYFLEEDSYNVAKSSRVFSDIPQDEAENYAIKLKEIYYGKGLVFDFTKIPDDPEYIRHHSKREALTASVKLRNVFILFQKNYRKFMSKSAEPAGTILKKRSMPYPSCTTVSSGLISVI
ncbi:MAG: hypothetical protein U5K51_07625 [Flavobacteriaceae bacterium]|nr:hypothetical protein [Flavobacteriaceae bacterium]